MASAQSHSPDTIVAPITPPGHGAVAVVRFSGPQTKSIVSTLLSAGEKVFCQPRTLTLVQVCDRLKSAERGKVTVLDQALAVYFAAPQSFTGEDIVELQLHGSPYIQRRIIENAIANGARLANPGEFSERAFLNGQLDLSQAESIQDLVLAESELQLQAAQDQLRGTLSQAVSTLGEPLRDLLAEIEAHIDFPDEDIQPQERSEWEAVLRPVSEQMDQYLRGFRQGRLCREGARVALAGCANAGKSSLLNALLREERAIVTPIPGTTRDSIEERMSFDGLLVRLSDTAGLAESAEISGRSLDEIEKLGIERSWKNIAEADLVLFLWDGARGVEQVPILQRVLERSRALILVVNKVDLLSSEEKTRLSSGLQQHVPNSICFVSARQGYGLLALEEQVRSSLLGVRSAERERAVWITTQRHFDCLNKAFQALSAAQRALQDVQPAELVSLEIRQVLGCLDDIIGASSNEDILRRIFSKFCIGK